MFNYFFKNLNTLFLTCALAFISIANAQEVRVIDNKGTIKKINNNQVTTATTALPAGYVPFKGDVWFDDSATPTQTKIYDGGNWVIAGADPSVYTGVFVIDRATDLVIPTDNYTKNITGIPFQPSQVTFVAHANVASKISEGFSTKNDSRINNSFGTMNGFARALTGTTVPTDQQVIYVGGSGNSINSIGWFSSSNHCIGVRYGNNDAKNLGIIKGALNSFTTVGFNIDVTYNTGDSSADGYSLSLFRAEKLVVLYTAYR
jgi:hypothetical protein